MGALKIIPWRYTQVDKCHDTLGEMSKTVVEYLFN